MTSHDVVSRVRRLTGEKSVGHLGTLDPMATGVLPLLLGKYTRLAQFFSLADKSYTGTIRFGFATDTYDAEGQPVGPVVEPRLTLDQVRDAAIPFRGEGKPVELKPKVIQIHAFTIESLDRDTATFSMQVSAGGYVRSVAHELGAALGCGAHLSSLRRTQAGVFGLEHAWTLDALADLGAELERAMLHPRTLLPEMPCVTGDGGALGKLRNGNQANLADFSDAEMVKVFAGQRELVAVAKRVVGTLFQPMMVLG